MAYLVHRHSVEEEQVVGPFSAMHVQTGHKFRSGVHSRQVLYGLDKVGRTENHVSIYEIQAFKTFVSCLASGYFLRIFVGRDFCFDDAVPSFRHFERVRRACRSMD